MSGAVVELTDDAFSQGIVRGVVLVDFYGTYCPPCALLEPVLEKLAVDFAGRAVFAKINIDDNSEAAVDNAVDNIPTLILFKDGVEQERIFGAQKEETIAELVSRYLS